VCSSELMLMESRASCTRTLSCSNQHAIIKVGNKLFFQRKLSLRWRRRARLKCNKLAPRNLLFQLLSQQSFLTCDEAPRNRRRANVTVRSPSTPIMLIRKGDWIIYQRDASPQLQVKIMRGTEQLEEVSNLLQESVKSRECLS
jgi:hypothetical protein